MAPHNKYESYYLAQAGSGMGNFYAGRAHMRGYGVADFLRGIFRSVFPYIKSAGRTVAKEGAKAALHVLSDVSEGEVPLGESVKRRATDAAQNLKKTLTGSGYKKPRVLYKTQLTRAARSVQTQKTKRAPPKKAARRDIFSP